MEIMNDCATCGREIKRPDVWCTECLDRCRCVMCAEPEEDE